MRFGKVHKDMERYLREDCYCPGEIYGVDGFFFQVFTVEDECRLIERSEDMTAVIATTNRGGQELPKPQAIIFWHDEGDGSTCGYAWIRAPWKKVRNYAASGFIARANLAERMRERGWWYA